MAINTNKYEFTSYTPAYLNYVMDPMVLELFNNSLPPEQPDAAAGSAPSEFLPRLQKLTDLGELARVKLAKASQRQCQVGEEVMLRERPLSMEVVGFAAKLAPRYSGPWTIRKKLSPNVYDLQGSHGRRLTKIHIKRFETGQ